MLETIGVEARGTTDDSVHLVSLFKEQFGTVVQGRCMIATLGRGNSQVRTVLAGDTCVEYNE